MSAAIATEMQTLARKAAEPIPAGETVKGQLRRAVSRLRLPGWRVRAAWYGEAGCWSGQAIEEFRARAARLAPQTDWESARAELEHLRATMARLAAHLDRASPEADRGRAALDRAAERPMAGADSALDRPGNDRPAGRRG